MQIFIFLVIKSFVDAFNDNLTAVHYSIVSPGIDQEIKAGNSHRIETKFVIILHFNNALLIIVLGNPYFEWQCDGCTLLSDSDSIIVENRFAEPEDFRLFTEIDILETQNIRITVELIDYVADLVQARL